MAMTARLPVRFADVAALATMHTTVEVVVVTPDGDQRHAPFAYLDGERNVLELVICESTAIATKETP